MASPAKHPTTSMHYVRVLLRQARQKGFSPEDLLRQADIRSEEIDAHHRRIDTYKLAHLVQLIWDKLQDENLGYSKIPCRPGTFYMMGRLTVHEPTLEKAMRLGIRFYRQFVHDYDLSLDVSGEVTTLSLVQRHRELDPDHVLTELILIAWHRYCSWLIGHNIALVDASFSYPPPRHVDEYKFLLPTWHRFNADETGFSFKSQYLRFDVVQNTETLKAFMARCPADLFLQHSGDESLNARIRHYLEKQLATGLPNLEEVAGAVNMTPQTLRRKLKSEGTSYQQIKDIVRRDVALYHLTQKYTPVSEVARLVGFSEPGVFVRAFKTWTGTTPSRYRNSLH